MPKILLITGASRTGAPLVALKLAQTIVSETNYSIYTLYFGDGTIRNEFAKYGNVNSIFYDFTKLYLRVLRRFNIIKSRVRVHLDSYKEYELIYANSIESLKYACQFRERYGIPIVLHIHEMPKTIAEFGASKELLSNCSHIIVVNKCIKDFLIASFGIPDDNISIIYPFSYYDFIPTRIKKEPATFIIGFSGTLGWRKGYDLIPLLINRLNFKYPQFNFKIALCGREEYHERKNLAYDLSILGLTQYLQDYGVLSNPSPVYNSFDIFLLLSREESFSLASLECSMLGKPVVCFENAVGFADYITENKSGIIVPFLNLEDMADAIYLLYKDKEKRDLLGENARNGYKGKYTRDYSITKILGIIDSVATSHT